MNADQFARIVNALTRQYLGHREVGIEWLFMVPGTEFDINAWVPRDDMLVLQLVNEQGEVQRTVAVVPGEYRRYEVIANQTVIGEARAPEAAFSIALDYVTAPARAAQQNEHDAVAV